MTSNAHPVPKQILLHQPGGRPWGMPNMGPFCIKLETYLRMAGWGYEWQRSDFRRAPKGKIPYVSLDGELVGDSQLILQRLERSRAAAGQPTLDDWLDGTQHAIGHAVQRMLDEGTYFALLHLRWTDDAGWETYRPALARSLGPIKVALPLIRRSINKRQHSQGTGRHATTDIEDMAIADLTSLAAIISDNAFLLGDRPSTYDSSAFASIEATVGFPVMSRTRAFALQHPVLSAYRERVRAKWWSDLPVAGGAAT
jgi:glutathione S-transferase